MLLNRAGAPRDDFRCDGTTSVMSRTSKGREISISFELLEGCSWERADLHRHDVSCAHSIYLRVVGRWERRRLEEKGAVAEEGEEAKLLCCREKGLVVARVWSIICCKVVTKQNGLASLKLTLIFRDRPLKKPISVNQFRKLVFC